MKKGIRGLAVGMTLASILASAFYGADVRAEEVDNETEDGTKEVISTEIRPQDDYYGYINANVLREADIDPKYGYGSFAECYKQTEEKLYGIVDEIKSEKVHSSTDAQIIADYYNQIVTYDGAASDADKDFENVIKEIKEVGSKKEYTELLGKYRRLYGICPISKFSISEGFIRGDE